jgi:hypothetical protein
MRNRLQRAFSSAAGKENVNTTSSSFGSDGGNDREDISAEGSTRSNVGNQQNVGGGEKGSPKRNRGPKKIVRKTIERTKSVARKRITGDPNYRIRDFLKVPKTIKTVDKVAFFSGVFGLLITEAVAVKYPELFWVFYCIAMPILLLTRMV